MIINYLKHLLLRIAEHFLFWLITFVQSRLLQMADEMVLVLN